VAVLTFPSGVITLIFPVVALLGTFTLISVAVFVVMAPFAPLNVTLVAPERFVPLIVTTVPIGPEAGLNLVIVGGGGGVACMSISLTVVLLVFVTQTGAVGGGAKGLAAHVDGPHHCGGRSGECPTDHRGGQRTADYQRSSQYRANTPLQPTISTHSSMPLASRRSLSTCLQKSPAPLRLRRNRRWHGRHPACRHCHGMGLFRANSRQTLKYPKMSL
jgi:hypothetical protein